MRSAGGECSGVRKASGKVGDDKWIEQRERDMA